MEPPLERPAGKFVGREEELDRLRELHGRPGSQVAVVHGRRRVGKTALIREALAGEHMLSLEGLENQGKPKKTRNFLSSYFSRIIPARELLRTVPSQVQPS